jgi:type IV pilus assembly protein PilB
LEAALQEQKRAPALLGEILLRSGYLPPAALAAALAEQGGVPYLDLAGVIPAPEALARIPEAMARRLRVLPLALEERALRLAMANIFDLDALAEVEAHCQLRVAVLGAAEEDILAHLAQAYGGGRSLEEVIEEAIHQAEDGAADPQVDQPIARLVTHLLHKALGDRATDLHFQPGEHLLQTRFRVDGALVPGPALPKALQAAVTARLKVMAEVDLAESRRPQDGSFRLAHGRRRLDVRASFLPVQHSEQVVLRILDKSNLVRGVEQLGMTPAVLEAFTAALGRPHGMLLVTGPTGSGKTTTLYSALGRLDTGDRCIITVEDPVEYELPRIAQCAVNPKAGLTFAAGLRAILRQDPDVILVGEIRDPETAGVALRAALTGHLVLATLHTGAPVEAIARLKDLGLSGPDLASALLAVHSQRLVRLNCPDCAGPHLPGAEVRAAHPGAWTRSAGCPACAFTGVRGRRAIHDLLAMTAQARTLVAAGAPPDEIEALARRQGKGSLREHAMELARSGAISLEEALRVTVAED